MATAMVVQLNDPDPWAWIALYGLTAAACTFSAFRPLDRRLVLLGLVVILTWMAILAPAFMDWLEQGMPSIGDEMKASHPYIEQVREFLGLLLCGGILIFLYIQENTKKSKT